MTADAGEHHFGEFLRQRIKQRGHGQILPILNAAGLSRSSAYRFFDANDPGPLNIDFSNKLAAAEAAGFASWEELDKAWRAAKVVREDRKATGRRVDGIFAHGLLTHSELDELSRLNDWSHILSFVEGCKRNWERQRGVAGKIVPPAEKSKSAARTTPAERELARTKVQPKGRQ